MSTDIEEDPPTQRPAEQISDDQFWLVSYSEDDDRELTTKEIVAAMKRGEITLSTLVWRDGMGEWQSIASIDELRARAGFIVQPFLTDAPPRSGPEGLKAIAALADDIEELSSSEVRSAPPSSLAEADFLGIEDGEASLAPPRIDHAAFFKSSPPPDESDNKAAALPALPSFGASAATATTSAVPTAKPAHKSEGGGGLKWLLVALTVLGAAIAGFLLTPAKEDAPPPQPATALPTPAAAVVVDPVAPGSAANNQANAQPTEGAPQATPSGSPNAGAPPPAAVAAAPATQPQALAKSGSVPAPGNPAPATPAPAEAKPAPVTSPPPQPRVTSTDPFNKAAASAALSQAASHASSCRQPGDPSGTAQVEVTFSGSGRATRAIIGGPPFRGTATGSCIAQAMRAAQVPPFAGDLVTVQKRVVIQ